MESFRYPSPVLKWAVLHHDGIPQVALSMYSCVDNCSPRALQKIRIVSATLNPHSSSCCLTLSVLIQVNLSRYLGMHFRFSGRLPSPCYLFWTNRDETLYISCQVSPLLLLTNAHNIFNPRIAVWCSIHSVCHVGRPWLGTCGRIETIHLLFCNA